MVSTKSITKSTWIMTLASVAVVVGALYLAKGILLPLILSALISFLLSPICDWLERYKIGRIPAVLITVILTFTGLGIITSTAISQMAELAPKIATYQGNIEAKIRLLNQNMGATLRGVTQTTQKLSEQIQKAENAAEGTTGEKPYAVRLISSPPTALELFGEMFGAALEAIASAGIVIILVLFFLARREDLRDRFIRLVGQEQVTGTTQALQDAAGRVSRYLLMQLIVNVMFGLAVTIGLYWIGIPNAILWGILTTVLKFIPYIGVWIAAAAPTFLSLAISDGWSDPVLSFGLFALLEFFVGNFLEPWLFGKHTGVSAVAIMVAAVFWSWLWGGVGLLLATPLTVCLLVIGKHVPQLAFLDVLLGDEPVFDGKTRVYQRLVAGDLEEATEVVEEYASEMSLMEVYDSLLIPALVLAEKERNRGEIDLDRLEFIHQGIRGIVEELGEVERIRKQTEVELLDELDESEKAAIRERAFSLTQLPPRLLCVSAATQADEIVSAMCAQLAELHGIPARLISFADYVKLDPEAVVEIKPELVCISALPPASIIHARSAWRNLVRRIPGARIIVGLWTHENDLARISRRIGGETQVCLASTLQIAMEPILALQHSSEEVAHPPVNLTSRIPVLAE